MMPDKEKAPHPGMMQGRVSNLGLSCLSRCWSDVLGKLRDRPRDRLTLLAVRRHRKQLEQLVYDLLRTHGATSGSTIDSAAPIRP